MNDKKITVQLSRPEFAAVLAALDAMLLIVRRDSGNEIRELALMAAESARDTMLKQLYAQAGQSSEGKDAPLSH
jgi:hypothetical protein